MSDLFEKLEDGRYLRQDGLPVYKYKAPDPVSGFYRAARDMMGAPEYAVPLVASFAAAAYTTLTGDHSLPEAVKNFGTNFSACSTLSIGLSLSCQSMSWGLQDHRRIQFYNFDRQPQNSLRDEGHKVDASFMKLGHSVMAATFAVLTGIATKALGVEPLIVVAGTGLVSGHAATAWRYSQVTNGNWAFEETRGRPPPLPPPSKDY